MEIHQSICQNTLSFLGEEIFEFKVDSCAENKRRGRRVCETLTNSDP